MKKIAVGMFIFFISFSLVIFIVSVSATPSKGDNCNSCHDEGSFEIEADKTTINVESSAKFTLTITASGQEVIVEAHEDAEDNDKFDFDDEKIQDDDSNDDDSDDDEVEAEFEIKAPSKKGDYTILIIARQDSSDEPDLVTLEIKVTVGEPTISSTVITPLLDILSTFFDHMGIYLGGLALILLTIGTVLVMINENKFVKTHGYLAGISLILTTVNVLTLVLTPSVWMGSYPVEFHAPHIILGALGLFTGALSMIFGIAAERKYAKLLGYFTLLFWWGAFFTGILL